MHLGLDMTSHVCSHVLTYIGLHLILRNPSHVHIHYSNISGFQPPSSMISAQNTFFLTISTATLIDYHETNTLFGGDRPAKSSQFATDSGIRVSFGPEFSVVMHF